MKRIISLWIIMGCIVSLHAQWHFHNPLPQGNTLRDVYFFDLQTGLAVGDGGTIMKTSDGGMSWEMVTAPVKSNLYALDFISSHVGFICGSSGTILRSSNGGMTWEETVSGTTVTLRDIQFYDSPRGYVVGDNGTILVSHDCGFTWSPQVTCTASTLHALNCLDPLRAFTVGDDGTILSTINGGGQWDLQESGTTEPLFKVVFSNEYRGWICGNAGIILRTLNAGESWVMQESGIQEGLCGLSCYDENKVWAAGKNGKIICTTDGGVNWMPQNSNSDRGLNAVFSVNGQTCFIAGDNGIQIMTFDGGMTWKSGTNSMYDPGFLRFAGFTDELHAWACDGGSNIVHSNDGGITWTVYGTNPGPYWHEFVLSDPQTGFSLNGDYVIGEVDVTHDGGITWDSSYRPQQSWIEHYTSVFFISPDTGWVGGILEDFISYYFDRSFVILKTTDGGQSWSRKVISPPPTECIWGDLIDLYFTDGLHGWAIGYVENWDNYYSYLLKTSNGGASWSLVSCNLGGYTWWDGDHIIYFNNMKGYAIDDWGGNIFKTTSGGSGWNLINTGYSSHLEDGYFSDPENGWVIGSNGTILHTGDGGISWTQEACPTNYTLKRILFTPNGDGWIFGENSLILHLADTTMVPVHEPDISREFESYAYPNPFHRSTTISCHLDEDCYISLKIFNTMGQMVTELFSGQQSRGDHQSGWDAEGYPAGAYFYQLTRIPDFSGKASSQQIHTGKVIKLK